LLRNVDAFVGDELLHALLQDWQRNRAKRQDGVVEAPLVESGSKLLFRLAAMPADLQLAELVRQGLSGPRDVALDLSCSTSVLISCSESAARVRR